jgi:hypothetical protein
LKSHRVLNWYPRPMYQTHKILRQKMQKGLGISVILLVFFITNSSNLYIPVLSHFIRYCWISYIFGTNSTQNWYKMWKNALFHSIRERYYNIGIADKNVLGVEIHIYRCLMKLKWKNICQVLAILELQKSGGFFS